MFNCRAGPLIQVLRKRSLYRSCIKEKYRSKRKSWHIKHGISLNSSHTFLRNWIFHLKINGTENSLPPKFFVFFNFSCVTQTTATDPHTSSSLTSSVEMKRWQHGVHSHSDRPHWSHHSLQSLLIPSWEDVEIGAIAGLPLHRIPTFPVLQEWGLQNMYHYLIGKYDSCFMCLCLKFVI